MAMTHREKQKAVIATIVKNRKAIRRCAIFGILREYSDKVLNLARSASHVTPPSRAHILSNKALDVKDFSSRKQCFAVLLRRR